MARLRDWTYKRIMEPPALLHSRGRVTERSEVSENQKNIALEDLHDCNETLYHRVFVDYLDEMGPVD
jgi:hypothetical protein